MKYIQKQKHTGKYLQIMYSVTSTIKTNLPENLIDRFCVLGELASIWQVILKTG
jgi:hypothetical protein